MTSLPGLITSALVALLVAAVVVVVVDAVRGNRPGWWALGLMAASEIGCIITTIWVIWRVSTTDQPSHMGLFAGYLLCIVGILPLAFFWGIGEKSRWGNVVIAVGEITIVVLLIRMTQILV